jgi:hypothetical protein
MLALLFLAAQLNFTVIVPIQAGGIHPLGGYAAGCSGPLPWKRAHFSSGGMC